MPQSSFAHPGQIASPKLPVICQRLRAFQRRAIDV